MNEAKHTPEPWFVNESEDKYERNTAMSKDDDQMSEADDQMLAEEYREHEGWVGAYATEKKIERLEAANNELLEALKDCCVIAKPENPPCCCPNYQPLPDGDCAEAKNGNCHIWKAIQKARGQG